MRYSRLFIASILLLGLSFQAPASIIYVNKSATGANNGSTWADASANLQAMIDASAPGDEVWVAAGTFIPAGYPTGCTLHFPT